MKYSIIHFLIALVTVCILFPCAFLLGANVLDADRLWPIFVFFAVSLISFILCKWIVRTQWVLYLIFKQLAFTSLLCGVYFVIEIIMLGTDSIRSEDFSFGEILLIWVVCVVVLSACCGAVGAAIRSLFSLDSWAYPASLVNRIAIAILAFFVIITAIGLIMEVSMFLFVFSLPSLGGVAVGFKDGAKYEEDTMQDEYGRTVSGHRYGDRFVESVTGNEYSRQPGSDTWRLM